MLVEFGGQPVWLALISAGRPENVKRMEELLGGVRGTWYVPYDQRQAYLDAGAAQVTADDGSLVGARNAALEHGDLHKLTTVELSDDLKKIQVAVDGKAHDATADQALGGWLKRFALSDYYLAGVAPTNNAFFSKGKASSANLFCVGDCIAVKPRSELRFDPFFKLKEDYDYTARHILTHGGVFRADDVLMSYAHYTNAGGVVSDVRSEELEQQMIAELLRRYPGMVKPHPRRKNEVLLRAPRAKKATL